MNPAIGRFLSMNICKVRRHARDSFARQSAYIRRTAVINPRTGQRHDYRKKDAPEVTGIVGWSGTHKQLIAAAGFAEIRGKAVEGRIAILALPTEFTEEERHAVTKQCAEYLSKKHHVAVAYAIHLPPEKGDQRNWHAHLLFTSRRVIDGVRLGAKTREWDALTTGSKHIEAFRSWWCAALNTALQKKGHTADIQHKSFARLGIEKVPSEHNGERRTAILRRRTLRSEFSNQPEVRGVDQNFRPLMAPSSIVRLKLTTEFVRTPVLPDISNPSLRKSGQATPTEPAPPIPCSSTESGADRKTEMSSYELDFENPHRPALKLPQRQGAEVKDMRQAQPPAVDIPDKLKDPFDDAEFKNPHRIFRNLPQPRSPEPSLE